MKYKLYDKDTINNKNKQNNQNNQNVVIGIKTRTIRIAHKLRSIHLMNGHYMKIHFSPCIL